MDLNFPDADGIDSTCKRKTPGGGKDRCGEEAVTYFSRTDGTRLYVCREHALEVLRFPTEDVSDLPDDYNELRSLAASEGINLQSPTRKDLLERLLRRRTKDPDELPKHPRVRECPRCKCVTLVEETSFDADACMCCSDDAEEVDVALCYPGVLDEDGE